MKIISRLTGEDCDDVASVSKNSHWCWWSMKKRSDNTYTTVSRWHIMQSETKKKEDIIEM